MRYTIDGTTPTSSHGTLISASSGTASGTVPGGGLYVKVIAMKSGYNTTAVVTSGQFARSTG